MSDLRQDCRPRWVLFRQKGVIELVGVYSLDLLRVRRVEALEDWRLSVAGVVVAVEPMPLQYLRSLAALSYPTHRGHRLFDRSSDAHSGLLASLAAG